MKGTFTKKHLLFVLIFAIFSVVTSRINFSALIGAENQYFTLFQFVGPIAGGFLGVVLGPLSVGVAEIANFLLLGKALTLMNVIRIFPMMFAAFYFAKMRSGSSLRKLDYIIPGACMALFVLHPEGRAAWFYSLYWLIPMAMRLKFFKNRVFARSLGATFTAHAIGSTAFLWSTGMSAKFWVALIPIVAVERLLFASGIAGSYVGINSLLNKFSDKVDLTALNIDKRYLVSKYFAKLGIAK